MNGLELASYILLWVVVIAVVCTLIGIVHSLGSRRVPYGLPGAGSIEIASIDKDGPAIGELIPTLEVQPINSDEPVRISAGGGGRRHLVAFMSPLCESCQATVDPLNDLARSHAENVQITVFMRASADSVRNFLTVFPFDAPVVVDGKQDAMQREFHVHRSPFALLYDERGALERKGTIADGKEGVRALLGDSDASPRAWLSMYPPLAC